VPFPFLQLMCSTTLNLSRRSFQQLDIIMAYFFSSDNNSRKLTIADPTISQMHLGFRCEHWHYLRLQIQKDQIYIRSGMRIPNLKGHLTG
jgi:hypothetical protein